MTLNTRDIRNLFNLSIDEDYYRPIGTKSAFNGNCIEYESRRDINKNLIPEEYLNTIRPYLSDMINDHKIHGTLKVYSGNKIIDWKTPGEWKIQLSIKTNFVFSKDTTEINNMITKDDNICILIGSETDEIIEELFKSLLQRYKKD